MPNGQWIYFLENAGLFPFVKQIQTISATKWKQYKKLYFAAAQGLRND